MHDSMQSWFGDLLMMEISTSISIPFKVNVVDIDISLEESFIEMQSDVTTCAKCNDAIHGKEMIVR